MAKTVEFVLNGEKARSAEGLSILEAARSAGVEIPSLCHLPGEEEPKRPCLLCMVEVEGRGRVRACATRVESGMRIETHTEELERFRAERLTALASVHYGDCRAPCNLTCPGGINVQGYVALIARGEYEAALKLIKEKNPLPVSVGRVCPRFCETRCRRVLLDEPIAINHLKRFVADYAIQSGTFREEPGRPTGKRVAIVGGGPAGLSCAYYLRRLGHECTIFEAEKELGGLLRYGIPGFRLPKRDLALEVKTILKLGVHVKAGRRWGDHFTLKDLFDQGFEAVFIATGLPRQKPLEVEGSEFVKDGLKLLKELAQGARPELGRRLLVVGGGDIAVDVARSAKRLGVQDVTVIYPRSRVEMPAHQRDIQEAEKEGVQFFLMATPLAIRELEDGRIRVEMARTVLGEPDEKGRRRPVPMPGSRLFWDGDGVVNALGQEGDPSFQAFGEIEAKIKLTPRNTIKSNPTTMATSVKGVFAGGDVVSGPRSVIQAVAAGRRAAEAIHEYLTGERIARPEPRFNFTKGKRFEDVDMRNFEGFSVHLSESMPSRPPERRIGDFDEVELGFTEEMAKREASRCLQCGCLGLSKCTLRGLCSDYKVATSKAPSRIQYPVDDSHPFILVDPNKCVACGRCERSCRYGALEFSFEEGQEGAPVRIRIRLSERCVSCGACVDACPTGALAKKESAVPLWPWEVETVKTVCTYCGTGCSVDVVAKGGAILEVRASDTVPPNWGALCLKGRFGWTFYRHPERLRRPMVRESADEPFTEVSWEEALEFVAGRLRRIRDEAGADAIGVLSSSRCTNEENYLLQKLARAVLGTNNVDNCARV